MKKSAREVDIVRRERRLAHGFDVWNAGYVATAETISHEVKKLAVGSAIG